MSNGTVVREEASGEGARAGRIVELVDRLLEDEADAERKKLLRRLRELAVGAAYPYPAPPAAGLTAEKLEEVRRTVTAIARTLGMKDLKRDAIPEIGKRVDELRKRIDRLAGVTGEEEDGERVSFRGLL